MDPVAEERERRGSEWWFWMAFVLITAMLCGTCGFAPHCGPGEPSCTCICKGEMGSIKQCECECDDMPPGMLNGEN